MKRKFTVGTIINISWVILLILSIYFGIQSSKQSGIILQLEDKLGQRYIDVENCQKDLKNIKTSLTTQMGKLEQSKQDEVNKHSREISVCKDELEKNKKIIANTEYLLKNLESNFTSEKTKNTEILHSLIICNTKITDMGDAITKADLAKKQIADELSKAQSEIYNNENLLKVHNDQIKLLQDQIKTCEKDNAEKLKKCEIDKIELEHRIELQTDINAKKLIKKEETIIIKKDETKKVIDPTLKREIQILKTEKHLPVVTIGGNVLEDDDDTSAEEEITDEVAELDKETKDINIKNTPVIINSKAQDKKKHYISNRYR